MPMVCCQIKGYGVLWNLYLLCVRKGSKGYILCATKLWRHSKWRWKDERPADRTKKHGSAFACVHRTPTRSQVAQEIRKRSSFLERKHRKANISHSKRWFHFANRSPRVPPVLRWNFNTSQTKEQNDALIGARYIPWCGDLIGVSNMPFSIR